MDGLFKDLENEIKFNQDQILTMNATKSLEDFANAGLQEINYTSYIVQTRSMISTLNVSDLIEILSGVRIVFNAADQVSQFYIYCAFIVYILSGRIKEYNSSTSIDTF